MSKENPPSALLSSEIDQSSSLGARIGLARHRHLVKGGREPKRLVIGTREKAAMDAERWQSGMHYDAAYLGKRATYAGMEVYVVDAETFLEVLE